MDPITNTPTDSNVGAPDTATASVSDTNAPDQTTESGNQGMATPEQMDQLKELMNKIDDKYRQTNAEAFAGGNQTEALRKGLVVDMFKSMQQLGVDMSDPHSVRQFLDEVEQANPDLYDLFVSAFEGLLGNEQPGGATGEAPGGTPSGLPSGAPTGALSSILGGAATPDLTTPGSTPSNSGLAGMVPPEGGIANQFPNLAKK